MKHLKKFNEGILDIFRKNNTKQVYNSKIEEINKKSNYNKNYTLDKVNLCIELSKKDETFKNFLKSIETGHFKVSVEINKHKNPNFIIDGDIYKIGEYDAMDYGDEYSLDSPNFYFYPLIMDIKNKSFSKLRDKQLSIFNYDLDGIGIFGVEDAIKKNNIIIISKEDYNIILNAIKYRLGNNKWV